MLPTPETGMPAPQRRRPLSNHAKLHGNEEDDDGSSSSVASSPDQRPIDMDRRRPRGDEDRLSDSEGDEDREHSASVTCALSEALAHDIIAQRGVLTASSSTRDEEGGGAQLVADAASSSTKRAMVCCVCGDKTAQYTCPGCKKRTCSLTCVRMHKAQEHCTGERNLTGPVPLAEFSDAQLRRDFHFLEDCRRVADTVASRRPKDGFHYSFHALPPPLYALREAAKIRGVLLQLISEGMRKRDVNTTRYDKRTDTVTWHVEFRFITNAEAFVAKTDIGTSRATVQGLTLRRNFLVSTSWGNERHLLGDILMSCTTVNPKLPLFHIRRGYSRASRWVVGDDLQARTKRTRGGADNECDETVACAEVGKGSGGSSTPVEVKVNEATPTNVLLLQDDAATNDHERREDMPRTAEDMIAEINVKRFIEECGGAEGVTVLHRAERLGDRVLYFPMNLQATLHENLRTLFFLNEFPEFLVVRDEDLVHFELVSDADKEQIRESFRKKEKPTLEQRLSVLPKKGDLDSKTAELYSKIPCRQYIRGACVRPVGDCPYWHCEASEVPACRHMVLYGECTKGKKCSFQHDPDVVSAAKAHQAAFPEHRGGRGGGRGGWRGGRGGVPHHSVPQALSDSVPGVILTSSSVRPSIHISLPILPALPCTDSNNNGGGVAPGTVQQPGRPRFIQPPSTNR